MQLRTLLLALIILLCNGGNTMALDLFSEVEDVVYDSLYNRYLVSCYVGRICAVDAATNEQSLYASVYGTCGHLYIVQDTLWVALDNRISARNLETGEEYFSVNIAGVSSGIHDLVSDHRGYMYIFHTFFGSGCKIYKMDMSTHAYTTFASIYTVNPLSIDYDSLNNQLVLPAMGSSEVLGISLVDSSVYVVGDVGLVGNDAICQDQYGNFYMATVSPDPTKYYDIYRYNHDFTSPPDYIAGGILAMVNFCINPRNRVIAACSVYDDSLTYIPMHSRINLDDYRFDDVEYGDGDNVPEAGEIVGLSIGMRNIGWGEIENLSISISFDDASVIVLDGTADYGSLAPDQIVSNISDPLLLEIPADYVSRIDSLIVNAAWDNENGSDAAVFGVEIEIGAPDIIIIDDDGYGFENYYVDALSDLGIPSITRSGTPDITASELDNYKVVIWYTGYSASDYLEPDEIAAIKGYLSNGGSLFMTGQRIASYLDANDQDFLNNYLKAEYESTLIWPYVTYEPGGQIFDITDTMRIMACDAANNQSNPDIISAVNGGTAELDYVGDRGIVGVSYAGDYNSVFLSFGFEAICNNYRPWCTRTSVMKKILDFFGYQLPGSPPTVSALEITPGDPQHLVSHVPQFTWTYQDVTDQDQQYLQVQVGTDPNWGLAEMWDSGPVAGDVPQVTYGGDELLDGQRYYVRVRSQNSSIWSNWAEGEMRINSVPVPANLDPSESDSTTELQPRLCHSAAYDAEGDEITYSYELYADADMTQLIEVVADIPPSAGDSVCWQVASVLTELEDYHWRVRCADAFETGQWSEPASFIIAPASLCGDANGDDEVNLGDAVFLVTYIFKGGTAPDPECKSDVNGDGDTNVGDAVYLIAYVFKGGPAPVEPCCL